GNTYFTTDAIRSRMKVRSSDTFSRGVFSQMLLEDDERMIETMYRNAGFENTDVQGNYEERDHVIAVFINIEEGTQLLTGAITFEGNSAFSDQELRKAIALSAGETYTPAAVEQARSAITHLYYSKGYPDVRVETETKHDVDNRMQVIFRITEGSNYRIGDIW